MSITDDLNKALEAGYIGPPPPPGFKPTHMITYGMKEDGCWYEHMLDLATGETVSTNMSLIDWKPSDAELWMSVPKPGKSFSTRGYDLKDMTVVDDICSLFDVPVYEYPVFGVRRKNDNLVNRLKRRYGSHKN